MAVEYEVCKKGGIVLRKQAAGPVPGFNLVELSGESQPSLQNILPLRVLRADDMEGNLNTCWPPFCQSLLPTKYAFQDVRRTAVNTMMHGQQ